MVDRSLVGISIINHQSDLGSQDYGAYLEADALAAAASCREMEWALQEVFRLAEQCSDYNSQER